MTHDGRPIPPDFLDTHPPPFDDSLDVNGSTPWDVLARWHREDDLVVDGGAQFVKAEAAIQKENTRARRETRDERHRCRRGWSLSLRDGGPPPGVRASVCTLAWTTASWRRFAPNKVSHRATEDSKRAAHMPVAAFTSASCTHWETTHAVAIAALTCAFERRILSLSNPMDRMQRRTATKIAAAAGDTLAFAAATKVLASKQTPSDAQSKPSHTKKQNVTWSNIQLTTVAIRAVEKTRAKARAIARVASCAPVTAIGAPSVAFECRRRARITRDASLQLDKRLGELVLKVGLTAGNSSHSNYYNSSATSTQCAHPTKTSAMGARAAVAEILARDKANEVSAAGGENTETVPRIYDLLVREKQNRNTPGGKTTTVAKVVASPTPRRALGEGTNRMSMF